MATKARNRFVQRVGYFETDLQLAEALIRVFKRLDNSEKVLAETLGVELSDYPKLNQKNTKASRDIRAGHLLSTLRSSFIKEIYEDFLEYLATTLERGAKAGVDPGRFVGSAKIEIQAKELLSQGDWANTVSMVSNSIFKDLESRRKTTQLVSEVIKKLGLNVDKQLVDAAIPYFELRHFLVHEDGQKNGKFEKRFPGFRFKQSGRVQVDKRVVSEANTAICALVSAIDAEIIANKLVPDEFLHP